MRYQKHFFRTLFFVFLLACLLTGLVGAFRIPANAAPEQASALDVVINEIAWAGTAQLSFDEWIELYTPSDIPIDLTGWRIQTERGATFTILGGSIGGVTPDSKYFVLERETDNVISNIVAGFVYSGSKLLLSDSGETLYLIDNFSNKIDVVNADGGAWPAGGSTPPQSMERQNASLPDSDSNWATNDGTILLNGIDALTGEIIGTPGRVNAISTYTIISLSNTPSTSQIGETVTLDVSVTGGAPVPAGIVRIYDDTTLLCPAITLVNGAGTCTANFSFIGPRNLIAEYTSSDGHPNSSVNVTHLVLYPTITTIISDSPDSSISNQNVAVSVSVTGGPTIPTGNVNITGADTNCTITLDATGKGACNVRFSSGGSKTLTATYVGDATHQSSSDSEAHQSIAPTPTPTRTPIPTLTPRPANYILPPPPPLVGINEFVPRPGHDWNNDGFINTDDEYIELINHGVVDVNLSGYRLDDEANIGSSPFSLPSGILKPGERIVFYGSQTKLLLSDGGDGVRLLKSNGQLVDAYNYFTVNFPDQAFCRLPDNGGLDDWNTNCFPTPGLQNSLSGTLLRPPTQNNEDEPLCPIADTLPEGFSLAECSAFGHNIWNRYYWDKFGWYDEMSLPNVDGKWDIFAD